jgi:drug/metabolite transporter (DMT)-like permease
MSLAMAHRYKFSLSVRTLLSLALGLAGALLLLGGMSHVLDSGTCGTGGPYEISRPCPHESALWGVALMAGLPVWMAGLLVSKGGLVQPGAGQVIWITTFAGIGLALLVKAATDHSLSSGSKLAIFIMAGIFIPMGLAVAIVGIVQLSRSKERSGPA